MKKFLLTMCVALLSVIAFAQYNVIVELIDGTEVKYSAKNVKNIRIEKGDSTQTDEDVVDAATSDFTFFILNDKEAEVTGLNIGSATVIVPAKVQIKGKVYTVTSIGEYALSYKSLGMKRVKEVRLPSTLKEIGESAFEDCESLTSINIPNSVTEIGDEAFYGCTSLTSIEIPNSVTKIGDYAFYGCTSLTNIVVDKDNKVYDSRDNCNAIIETASNTIIKGCPNTIIPNSVTEIGWGAFIYCRSLTSIEIPNSVTTIGEEAFLGCSSLTSIEIPESVTTIGDAAFEECPSLKTARVPKGCELGVHAFPSTCEIEWYGGAETTAVPADETGLKFNYDDWTMTASVKGLTDKEAKEVKIPSQVLYNGMVYDVTSIGKGAFYDCESLTSIEIPNSVTEIGYRAFEYCYSLTSIVVDKDNKVYDSRENCNAIIETASNKLLLGCQNTVIPNSVTEIGEEAFYECYSLTSIEIPNSVTTIGGFAFRECTSLTSIKIPNSVTSIGWGAFWGCESLTSIEIPNSVTEIEREAFWFCSKLKTARVPVSLKGKVEDVFPSTCEIEWYGGEETTAVPAEETGLKFKYDDWTMTASVTGLTDKEAKEVKIPSQVLYNGMVYDVTTIGHYAFDYCTSLTSIEIPNSVTEIGSFAFRGCKNLTSIVIPNSVTTIGSRAFEGCTSLTSIVIPNSVTSIGDYAFDGCTSLTSIEIPNSVTSIGNSAFWKCTSLTSIEIPNSVTTIGDYAFSYCESLTSIEIPNSVTEIGGLAFDNCTSLTSIEIPNSVTSIGEWAFADCTSLTSIEIPNSVTEIGARAFEGCSNLKTARVPVSLKGKIDSKVFPSTCEIEWYGGDVIYTTSIQLVAGGVYEARNPNKNFTFKVKSVSGSIWASNQVVVLTIDGFNGEFVLSDAGASYLIYDGSVFTTANTATAKANVKNIVARLAYNDSMVNYTITSATLSNTMNSLGATETTFREVVK